MKAIEQYFSVVFFFLILCKMVPTIESVDKIVTRAHSDESSSARRFWILCVFYYFKNEIYIVEF